MNQTDVINMKNVILFLIMIFSAMSLRAEYKKGDLLYNNEFDSKNALGGIAEQSFIPDEGISKDGAFRVMGYNGSNFISFKLDAEKMKGVVGVEAVVKGVDIKATEKPYHGAKVMMEIKRKNGRTIYSEPRTLQRSGSFDWCTVTMIELIPDDVESVTMMIGLQNTTGQFYIDSLKIFRVIEQP